MNDIIAQIKTLLIESLNLEEMTPDDIGEDDLLFGDSGLGLDSVDALELVMEIERNFGVQIQDDEGSRAILKSVRTLATYVEAQRNA
ncbi:MAG: phosphopantetheine-binding protein [Myxococcota bacterium]